MGRALRLLDAVESKKMKHLYLATLIVLSVSIGCSRPRGGLESASNVSHLPNNSIATVPIIYPHSAEFRASRSHGAIFREYKESCKACHGNDLSGGSSKVSCHRCHEPYPHSEDFKSTYLHGSAYFENRNSCAGCHDNSQDTSKIVNCTNCHNYPHSRKWALPQNHGSAFVSLLGSGALESTEHPTCLSCHSDSAKLKERQPDHYLSCSSCHILIPHSEEFKGGDHKAEARAPQSNCMGCHTDLRRLLPGTDDTGCYMCHPEAEVPAVRWEPKPKESVSLPPWLRSYFYPNRMNASKQPPRYVPVKNHGSVNKKGNPSSKPKTKSKSPKKTKLSRGSR
jgi:hypothetical protein